MIVRTAAWGLLVEILLALTSSFAQSSDIKLAILNPEVGRRVDQQFKIRSELAGNRQVFGSDHPDAWPLENLGSDLESASPPSAIRLVSIDTFETVSEETDPVEVMGDQADWHWLDTLTLFGGLEGSKQPQDFGVNANFGSRWAVNWGFPILAERGIGGQIGTSLNYTNNAVQVFERVGESSQRTQNFSTVGVFQRTETWRWGLGYDFLYESYYDQFLLGQWRGRVGYATSQRDEFGVWFAIPQQNGQGTFLAVPVQLSPLAQGSAYWQHQFEAGSRVIGWAGVAQGHAQANYALGDLPHTGCQFVFGAEVDVPLNRYFSMYGQANFISPADSGTVDSYLGITYYPGGRAYVATRSPFAPFQALANSTMFAADLRR